MDHPSEPIEMPSREPHAHAAEVGEHWGHELGAWIHRVTEWRARAEDQLHQLQHFWEEVQHPEGRRRHAVTLIALAAGLGFVLGMTMRRPRS